MNQKELSDILKDTGLDIGEDAAIAAVKALFKALPKIALATDTKVDDMFVPVLGLIEPQIIKMLDDIYDDDGVVEEVEEVAPAPTN